VSSFKFQVSLTSRSRAGELESSEAGGRGVALSAEIAARSELRASGRPGGAAGFEMEVASTCIHEIRGGPDQITRPVSAKQRETRTRLRRTVVRIPEIYDERKTSRVGVAADG